MIRTSTLSAAYHIAATSMCLLAGSCRPAGPDDSTLVTAWLTCFECTDGELDTLKALVARKPATFDTLVKALFEGPSQARRDRMYTQLLASYPRTPALPMDSIGYAQLYTANAVAIYRTRAARAVAEIGGTRAPQVIDSALALPPDSLPDLLRSTMQFLRDSVLGP